MIAPDFVELTTVMMMDPSRQTDALLTEHFRYTPLTLIDDIINAVNTIVYRGIEAIENGLLNISPQTLGFSTSKNVNLALNSESDGDVERSEAQDEIENGVHQLETLLESTVDKAFDKFEIYTLRNVLTVPDDLVGWVRLGHYENIHLPLTEDAPSSESIHLLRRKLQETRKLNSVLRTTHACNAALLSELHSLLTPPSSFKPSHPSSLAFLVNPLTTSDHDMSDSSTETLHPTSAPFDLSFTTAPHHKPLTENTQFATSQLPALKKLVEDLRPRLKNLKEGKFESGGPTDGRKEERRAYIETSVQRAVRQIGRDTGEWEGGEKKGREEVEDLEGMLRGFKDQSRER